MTNVQGAYEIFVPQSTKGKYAKYANQLVAIVSITYKSNSRGGIKSAKLYFTDETDKTLGKPAFAKLGLSGSNVGIIPMDENDGECYVVNRKAIEGEEVGMPFVNITAFAKYIDLEGGVYNAHREPGKVVEFNRKSAPSKP